MARFHNSNQMKAFMKKESIRLGMNIKNIYTTFTARILLEKLSKHNKGTILVKGSSAETAYLGRPVRGITDIDLATLGPIEANVEYLEATLLDDSTDGIKFYLSKKPKTTPTGIYKTGVEARFDKMRQPLGIDIQENYQRLIEKETRKMPPIFEGDKEFDVIVPSFEEYLAEKLCIIVESNKPDVLNTRVKDFYDIYKLHGGLYNPEKLTEYFKKMLLLRGKINFEDASTSHLNKEFVMNHEDVWDTTKEKYDFLDSEIDLYGAVYYTRAVLREELQKNGAIPPDGMSYQKKVYFYR